MMPETDLQSLAAVESELARLNKSSAETFQIVVAQLQHKVSAQLLLRWANTCLQLANSGWHAWDAANHYMRLSPAVMKEGQENGLLAVGEYGLNLTRLSFESGIQYFTGVKSFAEANRLNHLQFIEAGAEALKEGFKRATHLLTEYFVIAFQLGEIQDVDHMHSWVAIATQLARSGRPVIKQFLEDSQQYPEANWVFAEQLYVRGEKFGHHYVQTAGQLSAQLVGVEKDFETIVSGYAEQNLSVKTWLSSLVEVLPQLQADEVKILLSLCCQIDHPDLLATFTRNCQKLPLEKFPVVATWLEAGLALAEKNPAAAIAFLKLESTRSIELLEVLCGQVRFSDQQRYLQLYSEALLGKRLRIEANGKLGDSEKTANKSVTESIDGVLDAPLETALQNLPWSDGECVFLPEVVGIYNDYDANNRWLKVALTHQLGCYEFGTFNYQRNGSYVAFRDFFYSFEYPRLAANLFKIIEAGRIDWQIQRQYKGISVAFSEQKQAALAGRNTAELLLGNQLLEALLQFSLDAEGCDFVDPELAAEQQILLGLIAPFKVELKTVFDAVEAVKNCYEVIIAYRRNMDFSSAALKPVAYRGFLSLDTARMNLALTALEEAELNMAEDDANRTLPDGLAESDQVDVNELTSGDVKDPKIIVDMDQQSVSGESDFEQAQLAEGYDEFLQLAEARKAPVAEQAYQYDEWDFQINDYRKRWCTLFEIREFEEDPDFVPETLSQHRLLANQVRKQLNMLRPELLRKVKGMLDGEELDLERAVEAVLDRRAGVSPREDIYIQRQRKERDVSALFLLDMSASTDDVIKDPATEKANAENPDGNKTDQQAMQDYDHMSDLSEQHQRFYGSDAPTQTRIIDLEKQSVVLMAEALQRLGDSYAICGFSGYGKDRVEYFLCKDFNEPYNHKVKARIGGIKPCRSTRMGPAIRHASKMLEATESRIKALIIISDGYPQDYDYGADRASKVYGIKDTTKALTEAASLGVQSFCLTVDPSGHDYLREMCPDQQYMVMQDITQLPNELSKIYRGLTT